MAMVSTEGRMLEFLELYRKRTPGPVGQLAAGA